MLLFIDIFHVCLTLLDFADGDRVVEVIIEDSEDLAKTRRTWAKFPSPMSSALLRSNYFLKWFDLILIMIINQKNSNLYQLSMHSKVYTNLVSEGSYLWIRANGEQL